MDNIYVSGVSVFNIVSASTVYSSNLVSTGDTIDGGSY